MNLTERIQRARRWDGRERCGIDGCTEYGTVEHVTAHAAGEYRPQRRPAWLDRAGKDLTGAVRA